LNEGNENATGTREVRESECSAEREKYDPSSCRIFEFASRKKKVPGNGLLTTLWKGGYEACAIRGRKRKQRNSSVVRR